MGKSDNQINDDGNELHRSAEIRAILAMSRTARDDAAKLGLKFEAYLLDMAVVALSEQLQRQD